MVDKFLNSVIDLGDKFIGQTIRIADALEVIAKELYKNNLPIEPVDHVAKKKAEEAEREIIIAELEELKIPYAKEMSTDSLRTRLSENRERALQKLADAKAPAKPAEPPKTEKPKEEPKPKVEKPKAEPKPPQKETAEIDDAALKIILTDAQAELGGPAVVEFFQGYKFSAPMAKVTAIPMDERPAFVNALKAKVAEAKNAKTPASDMDGLLG